MHVLGWIVVAVLAAAVLGRLRGAGTTPSDETIIMSPKGWCAAYNKFTGALLVANPVIRPGTRARCFDENNFELGRFQNYSEAKAFFDRWEAERGPPEVR